MLTPFGAESTAQRPVDSFLASAGRVYGNRVLGLMLAAFHEDGLEGAYALKWRGGTMLVLDRTTAEYYGMADAIVKAGAYDRILTAGDVADALRASFTGRDLLESAELQFELGALLDSALRISGTHMGNIQVREPAADQLHIVAHRGLDKFFLDRFGVMRADEPWVCSAAVRLKRRAMVEDLFGDPAYAPYYDVARATGFSAVQSTPILDGDAVSGVFSTLYRHPHKLSAHEAKSLDDLAEAARPLVAALG
jgi:hypothetical protein